MNDAESLRRHLERLKELRGEGRELPPRLTELKAWQSRRLNASYADIAAQDRYRAATSFFLDDLYGPKDFTRRDREMLRILPTMSRMLPRSAVESASLAIELEALSEDLDQRLARLLAPGAIGTASYASAYRESSTPRERQHQIDLIDAVGRRLDKLVTKPFVHATLKLMRQPARLAGLSDLQDFLEHGFNAFREMGGAGQFLALVREREERIMSRLFSGASDPFSR